MAQQPNAILAINSTDRYITNVPGNVNQPVSNTLLAQYVGNATYDGVVYKPQSSSDFSITAPNALMNGYIDKIIISQIQLQYNLPTVVPGRNSTLYVALETGQGTSQWNVEGVTIPYGYYTPEELAISLQIQLDAIEYCVDNDITFTVKYNMASNTFSSVGFEILIESPDNRRFYFPAPNDPNALIFPDTPAQDELLKAYKLFGITYGNATPQIRQKSQTTPVFLYTPFIDIYSDALTNYQALKDTDSSTSRRKGLLARLYLSGVGNPQTSFARSKEQTSSAAFLYNGDEITGEIGVELTDSDSLGCSPFLLTFDLNSPKVIKWTPDTAVNSLDFQMRDCYGDLLWTFDTVSYTPGYSGELFNTEFQMTLLCVEKKYK